MRGFATCATEGGLRWAYGPGQKCLQHRRRGCHPCNSLQDFLGEVQQNRQILRRQVAAPSAVARLDKPERETAPTATLSGGSPSKGD